jgi:hypothetical protein
MGSIAEEMKKVIQQWDAEDEQPQQESKMETKKQNTITSVLLGYIADKPGITSLEIKARLAVERRDIPPSHVSSMLKQFTDNFSVTRVHAPEKIEGRLIYAYSIRPEAERNKMQAHAKLQRQKAKARAEYARSMKQKKLAEQASHKELQGGTFVPYEKQSISDLATQYAEVNAMIERVKPTEWSVDEVLDNLTVKQARALHIALKEMFGGV